MAKRLISTGRARYLAAQASVDPRTIVKILKGENVNGLAGDRARRILSEAGLLGRVT
jgi:hypothetical protein